MTSKSSLTALICLTSVSLLYSDQPVGTSTDLQNAIIAANGGGAGTGIINFTSNIDLTVPFGSPNLRPIDTFPDFSPATFPITVNGLGNQLQGGGNFRGFFVRGGSVTLNGINFIGTASFGGNGGETSGGGGAGIGGAMIVDSGAVVTLTNCSFSNSLAQGGNGGIGNNNPGAGGGGGLGGIGGEGAFPNYSGGGGGGLDFEGGSAFNPNDGFPTPHLYAGAGGAGVGEKGGDSNQPTHTGPGDGGNNWAGTNGGAGGTPGAPGGNGGGGGGGTQDIPSVGGAGGLGGMGGGGGGAGGAGNFPNPAGGGGDYGGGGGGSNEGNVGGPGGFGGGGGGGGIFTNSHGFGIIPGGAGGAGGFGGGGGGGGGTISNGTTPGTGGIGGFGGGNGGNGGFFPNFVFEDASASGGGGGGAGFGGAIFIRNGGRLTIEQNVPNIVLFDGNSVVGGTGGASQPQTAPNIAGDPGTDGSAAGADIFMMSGSFLTFNLSTNANVPNPIQGNQGIGGGDPTVGGIIKTGCARLTLNGANTFTGTTDVNEGELRIDGSVITNITVADGALLSGNFSMSGNLNNSGTLAPGDGGVGQVNINGNFVNSSTGIVQVDITPIVGDNDLITVTGTANLAGVLDVVVNAGNYIKGTQYTVINGATTGKFDKVIETGVNADLVQVDVSYSSVILTIVANRIFQNQFILPGVQSAVAGCIIDADIVPGSDFGIIVQELGLLNDAAVNRALYKLSPVNYGALDWINARNNNYLAYLLSQHVFDLCCSPDCCPSVWVDVFGNLMINRKHYNNLGPFIANAVGTVAGIDYCFCQNWTGGTAFAYTHTWLDWLGDHGKGNINSYYGALYGSFQSCYIDIDASVIGGASDHHLTRRTNIHEAGIRQTVIPNLCGGAETLVTATIPVDIDRRAKSNPWGYFFTGHLGIRTDWECCCTTVEPFAVFDYNYFLHNSFKEHGADSLNLRVKDHHQNLIRGEAGVRLYHTYVCECSCWAPFLGVSWVGEFPLGHSKEKARFVGQSCEFEVKSYHSSVQLVSPEAGFKWTRNSGFSFLVGYKGLYNSRTTINEVEGRLEWVF